MILLGSQAAKLRGDLPDWSAAQVNDIDLCGTVAEFEALDRHLEVGDLTKWVADLGNDRRSIRIRLNKTDRILIDFVTTERPSSVLLHAITDHLPTQVFGLDCLMVSAQTELVSKLAYAEFDIWREKNDRWIEHWESVVGEIEWTPDLRAFHDQLREEYRAYTAQREAI